MSNDDPVAWLRAQVEARLALAREAAGRTDGHWWRRMADAGHFDDRTLEPVGHLWAGEPVLDVDGDVFGGEEIVAYDEGHPSDVQFDHIASNDPQDTIARCEAELAILDKCDKAVRVARTYRDGDGVLALACAKTWLDAVRLLADGYKHRPGYAEAFGSSPALS